MDSRERVLAAFAFETTDRAPMDLGGMASTGISCFAYPGLVRTLGLPYRPPRVFDTGQMLALPDEDVLDALQCDVVCLQWHVTNAFPQPELWHAYDFNGRLSAEVLRPADFEVLPDGTIIQPRARTRMPPTSHVFGAEHGGQPLLLQGELPRPDLEAFEKGLAKALLTPDQIREARDFVRRARQATRRAVLCNTVHAGIGIGAHTGIAMFPMLCLVDPEYVAKLHEIAITHATAQLERLLPEIGPHVDVWLCSADDWGTQNATLAAPEVFRQLFKPYYRRMNDAIHHLAPNVKTFLHSCGAIYDILDDIIACGFDALNPVQWTAGGKHWSEWKQAARRRITLWGGGVNTQATLPLGGPDEVEREVTEIVDCLGQDGGYVFCAIHNLLAEIRPENTIAMYRAARKASSRGK